MRCFVCVFSAVQEERQRNKEKGEGEAESTVNANSDMPVEKILEAEIAVEPKTDTYIDAQVSSMDREIVQCSPSFVPLKWCSNLSIILKRAQVLSVFLYQTRQESVNFVIIVFIRF